MRTTTVTWLKGHVTPEDLEAKKQRMYDAAISIAGESYKDEINQTSNEENGS
jgi:cation transport regulator ChaB